MRARRARWTILAAPLAAALLVAVPGSDAADAEPCPAGQGTHREVEAGIVKAVGCFTETKGDAGATVYNAKGEVDLNGFIVEPGAGGLSIDTESNRVWGAGENADRRVQLKSRNWPVAGADHDLGDPFALDFHAPPSGSLTIEDLHLGSNFTARALAGFSPVGDVETPIEIEEGGKGSMNLTITLSGYFALKGKPQSAVVRLPTESGEGTRLDGFEIKLKEIDAIDVFKVVDFEAEYSAEEKRLAGGATLSMPFMGEGKGFGGKFAIVDGRIATIGLTASGLEIPIGAAPPAGMVTELGGSVDFLDKGFDFGADIGADFGPEVPTPWGKVAPIGAKAALKAGYDKGEVFFTIHGGLQVFRLPVGDAYLDIYTNTGVKFGAGIGIGFPSYRNNSKDPFYIGARIDGWVAKGKFQFEGNGKVALFNANLFEGRVLVNDRAAGACWKVLLVPGGAVYRYGDTKVKTFGVGCGLDAYREQFPRAAGAVAAGSSRTIRLDDGQVVLNLKGAGGPPRFTLRSADGRRVYSTPEPGDDVAIERDHAFFVNTTGTDRTHLVLRRPGGSWTVEPKPGSPAITSLKAGRRQKKERVRAQVRGRGAVRTLVWRSAGRANTRLIFTEKMRGGLEIPILDTDRANGRHRFRVAQGSHYGKRRLRVVVKHGYGSRQAGHLDGYRVRPPARLRGPRLVRASRQVHDVRVRWSPVRRASGYLVELKGPRGEGRRPIRYVRRVAPRRRALTFRDTAGGGRLRATVYALNSDGEAGAGRTRAFRASPAVRTIAAAAEASARSTRIGRRGVRLRSQCPPGGHCTVRVIVRGGRWALARTSFQQPPDSFRDAAVLRAPRRAGRGRGRGRRPMRVSVAIRQHDSAEVAHHRPG